jgi:hypothetical protein
MAVPKPRVSGFSASIIKATMNVVGNAIWYSALRAIKRIIIVPKLGAIPRMEVKFASMV